MTARAPRPSDAPPLPEALAECLARLEQGEDAASALAGQATSQETLAALLDTASLVRRRSPRPCPRFRAALGARLRREARAAGDGTPRARASVRRAPAAWRPALRTAAAVLALAALGLGATAVAAAPRAALSRVRHVVAVALGEPSAAVAEVPRARQDGATDVPGGPQRRVRPAVPTPRIGDLAAADDRRSAPRHPGTLPQPRDALRRPVAAAAHVTPVTLIQAASGDAVEARPRAMPTAATPTPSETVADPRPARRARALDDAPADAARTPGASPTPEAAVLLSARPYGGVSGTVRFRDMSRFPDLTVTAYPLDEAGEIVWEAGVATRTDVDGRYAIAGLAPGGVKVAVGENGPFVLRRWYRDTWHPPAAEVVLVAPGRTTTGIDVRTRVHPFHGLLGDPGSALVIPWLRWY